MLIILQLPLKSAGAVQCFALLRKPSVCLNLNVDSEHEIRLLGSVPPPIILAVRSQNTQLPPSTEHLIARLVACSGCLG